MGEEHKLELKKSSLLKRNPRAILGTSSVFN